MIDVESYIAFFGSNTVPIELLDLLEFQNESQDFFSSTFEIACDDGQDSLNTYSDDINFQRSFMIFAQADCFGSSYAFWLQKKGVALGACPIVIFGGEGGVQIVASDFRQLLQILSLDVEPMVDWSSVSFFKDADDQPSGQHKAYVDWLSKHNLSAISNADSIVNSAQFKYQEQLDDLISSVTS